MHEVAAAMAAKVAAVREALSDPAVAEEAGRIPAAAFNAAHERWSQTRIDGHCSLEEDIQIVDQMLSVKAPPGAGSPAPP